MADPLPSQQSALVEDSWAFREVLTLLLLVGIPLALSLSVFELPQMQITEVVIETSGHHVARAWIETQIEAWKGSSLLRLSIPEVSQRLRVHPWLKALRITKELPGRLRLRVTERVPYAVLLTGRSTPLPVLLEEDGTPIATANASDPLAALPTIETREPTPPAILRSLLVALATARQATPRAAGEVLGLRLLQDGSSIELRFANLPFAFLVDADDVAGDLQRLALSLAEIRAHAQAGAEVDLRIAREVVIR